jgi:hypothetical protein
MKVKKSVFNQVTLGLIRTEPKLQESIGREWPGRAEILALHSDEGEDFVFRRTLSKPSRIAGIVLVEIFKGSIYLLRTASEGQAKRSKHPKYLAQRSRSRAKRSLSA